MKTVYIDLKRHTKAVAMAVAIIPVAAFAAEDKTVAYGETLEITENATYANLVVNGTLNVAEGKKLTCDTFILGDNLDHTQDRVAKMTVASNATVTVNNSETLSGGSYTSTGYCKVGVNSRAELTLEGGSTFTAGGRMIIAPGCTGTVDKVVYVKVTLNDASLIVNGPLQFQGSRSHANAIENAVLALNGTKAILQPRYVYMYENSASARIKFNGGKLLASGWWNYGQQAVLDVRRNKQNLWMESVGGNPIWLSSEGGNNTHSFFYASNPWPNDGISQIWFEGRGPLVLKCSGTMPLCWDATLTDRCLHLDQIDCVRLLGGVSLGNKESVGLASNSFNTMKLELAAGSTFDVCGASFDIAALESAGTVVNSGASDATLTVGGSNGNVILSSPTLSDGVKLVKVGTGKLYAPAGPLANIEVRAGSFDFCDRASVGFPYYRYWVYGKSKGGGDNGGHCQVVRLCEIELYNGDVNVNDQATHVSWVTYGVNDRSPKNLFTDTATTAESWVSWWYSVGAADARPSNCVFAVIHMGGAPSFPFTGLAPYYNPLPTPVFDAIDNRPAVTKINEAVTSYRYRLSATEYYTYTNPEYFRFQGGLGDDIWIDLEDWESRGRYTKLNHNDSYNWSEAFALTYPTNAVSVERLDIADGVEWTLDAAQTDLTVGTLLIAGSGTLRIRNLGNVRGGTPLPVKFTAISGGHHLSNWEVYLDGVLCNRRICAENGMLAFARKGMAVSFK